MSDETSLKSVEAATGMVEGAERGGWVSYFCTFTCFTGPMHFQRVPMLPEPALLLFFFKF